MLESTDNTPRSAALALPQEDGREGTGSLPAGVLPPHPDPFMAGLRQEPAPSELPQAVRMALDSRQEWLRIQEILQALPPAQPTAKRASLSPREYARKQARKQLAKQSRKRNRGR